MIADVLVSTVIF